MAKPRPGRRRTNATLRSAAARLTARHESALTALLVVQGAVLFLVAPLVGVKDGTAFHATEFLVVVFGFLLVVLCEGRLATIAAAVLVAFTLVTAAINVAYPSQFMLSLTHTGSIVVLMGVGYVVSLAVFAAGPVSGHRLRGAIVLYLTIGLCFSTIYRLIHDWAPDGFSGLPPGASRLQAFTSLIYFSFVTLTSVGYGDITPLHPIGRSMAMLEAVIGQLYPATLLARLVTLHLESRQR